MLKDSLTRECAEGSLIVTSDSIIGSDPTMLEPLDKAFGNHAAVPAGVAVIGLGVVLPPLLSAKTFAIGAAFPAAFAIPWACCIASSCSCCFCFSSCKPL